MEVALTVDVWVDSTTDVAPPEITSSVVIGWTAGASPGRHMSCSLVELSQYATSKSGIQGVIICCMDTSWSEALTSPRWLELRTGSASAVIDWAVFTSSSIASRADFSSALILSSSLTTSATASGTNCSSAEASSSSSDSSSSPFASVSFQLSSMRVP